MSVSTDRHLWEYRWARDLVLIAVVALLLYALHLARAVTVPILIALVGAYVVNPLVTAANGKWRVPRWAAAMALLGVGLLSLAAVALYVVPGFIEQLGALAENLPRYATRAAEKLGIDWGSLTQRARDALDPATQPGQRGVTRETVSEVAANVDIKTVVQAVSQVLGAGLGYVGTVVGGAAYLGVVAAIIAFCFVSFSSHFNRLVAWCQSQVPRAHRERTAHIVSRMDKAISGFVRGRVIQVVVMAVLLTAGWGVVGVPYWLLIGVTAGVLNLVPYGSSVGLLMAVGLSGLEVIAGHAGFSVMHVIIWPTVVYGVAQVVDGWVVEPLVQGQATNLNPLTVMLAVLVGGAMAGMLGLILAIPVMACVNILAQELILPAWRSYADRMPAS